MDPKIKDNTFQQVPIYVKFNSLPRKIRERLISRMRGEGEGFAFKTAGIVSSYYLIAAAVIWFALLFFLADDYGWSSFKLVFFSLLSLPAAYFLLYNLYKVLSWFTSGAKCCLLVTPLYVIDIYFNDIRYWNLEQLTNINTNHRYQNDSYNFTEITLTLENGSKNLKINNLDTAEDTIEEINYFRKLFIEATVRNNAEYLDSNDDFRELSNKDNVLPAAAGSGLLPQIIIVSASIILTVGIIFAAFSLNNYYDDKRSWNDAQKTNRASSYRTYLQTHSKGRWTNDANQRLQALYDEAEQKYRASLVKGYEQKAVDAVLQILKYARETQNYHIKTVFERHNEIPPDIVEKLKDEYEVKNMIPLGDSFSDEKMKLRETKLVDVIADAFRYVIPDDILEISGECSGDCVTFLVKYKIDSDSIYYDTDQENMPENERTYNPGIFIDWDFGVQTPNQPEVYNFTLSSNPASHISHDTVSNDDLSDFYDALAASAFDDFKLNLIYKTGIGTDPTATAEDKSNEGKNTAATKKSKK